MQEVDFRKGLVDAPPVQAPPVDGVMMVFTKMLEAHYGACPVPKAGDNPVAVGNAWIDGCWAKLRADFGEYPMLLINAGYNGQTPKALFATRKAVGAAAGRALHRKKPTALIKSETTHMSFIGPAEMLRAVARKEVEELSVVIRQPSGECVVTAIEPRRR